MRLHLSRSVRASLLVIAALLILAAAPGRAQAEEAAAPPDAQSEAKTSLHTVEIPVEGMACFGCAGTIKSTVKSLAGVLRVEVSLGKRSARVTYFGDDHVPERIVAAIDKLGYQAGTPRETP